jgi:hypothetical protein
VISIRRSWPTEDFQVHGGASAVTSANDPYVPRLLPQFLRARNVDGQERSENTLLIISQDPWSDRDNH